MSTTSICLSPALQTNMLLPAAVRCMPDRSTPQIQLSVYVYALEYKLGNN